MKIRIRGYAIGEIDDVEHAHRIAMEVIHGELEQRGIFNGTSIRFIDKDERELYALPAITHPLNPFSHSTMQFIRKINSIDTRVHYTCMISAVNIKNDDGSINKEKKLAVAHYENRLTNITTDLLYTIHNDGQVEQCDIGIYKQIEAYGLINVFSECNFFEEPSIKFDVTTWDYINTTFIEIVEFSKSKDKIPSELDLHNLNQKFMSVYEVLNKLTVVLDKKNTIDSENRIH